MLLCQPIRNVYSRFPAVCTGYTFSRGLHWLHVFPRFVPVTCFPAFCTGYMFSRGLHRLRVFPRFALVAWFRCEFWLVHSVYIWVCCDWSDVIVTTCNTRPAGLANFCASTSFDWLGNIWTLYQFCLFLQIIAKKIRGIALSIRDQYVFSTAPISVKKILTIELAVQVREIFLHYTFTS